MSWLDSTVTNPSNEVDLGGLVTSELQNQSGVTKSLPEVPSKRHKHDWKLVDTYDSWKRKHEPLPQGQWVSRGGLFGGITYIPGFDRQTFLENLVDEIRQGDIPHFTSETWVCACGERMTNSRTAPSLHASLGLSQQLPQTKAKKEVRKNATDQQ